MCIHYFKHCILLLNVQTVSVYDQASTLQATLAMKLIET